MSKNTRLENALGDMMRSLEEVDIFKKYKQTIKASYDLIVEEERELEEMYKNGDIDEWTMEDVKSSFPRMLERYLRETLEERKRIDHGNLMKAVEDFNRS